jgi:hypothetical protein
MGAAPKPQDFALFRHPKCRIRFQAKGVKTSPHFGLTPWSALELRPRIALPSAKASNSVAETSNETYQAARSHRNDDYSSVTFSAEAIRTEKYLTTINHPKSID